MQIQTKQELIKDQLIEQTVIRLADLKKEVPKESIFFNTIQKISHLKNHLHEERRALIAAVNTIFKNYELSQIRFFYKKADGFKYNFGKTLHPQTQLDSLDPETIFYIEKMISDPKVILEKNQKLLYLPAFIDKKLTAIIEFVREEEVGFSETQIQEFLIMTDYFSTFIEKIELNKLLKTTYLAPKGLELFAAQENALSKIVHQTLANQEKLTRVFVKTFFKDLIHFGVEIKNLIHAADEFLSQVNHHLEVKSKSSNPPKSIDV